MFTSTNPKPAVPIRTRVRTWLAALAAAVSLAVGHGSAVAESRVDFSQAELDRMLAPIALYPDPLLSQILMAATYPVEVVEAARWSRAHPELQGDAAVRAVGDEDWDPSVKSLVAFPGVLARMDEDLEWTRQLGDAFLDQEVQVMDTVQALRRRARAAGSLASDARIRVVDDGVTLAVQPVDPGVIYVPYYDPRFAYGTWWWPAHPPVVWAPWPAYAVRYPRTGIAVGFFWGPAVRVSFGFFFGAIDWPRREVRVVNVTNYYYRPVIVRRTVEVHQHVVVVAPGRWHHDPGHRRGVAYRAPEAQHRYASAPPRERHAPERRPAALPSHNEPHVRAAPTVAPRTDRGTPNRAERSEIRRDAPPPDRSAERRQPGNSGSQTAPPPAASRAQGEATPAAGSEPARERSRDTRRSDPRSGSGSQSASPQDRRADPHATPASAPLQRGPDNERAERGRRQPSEAQVGPQRRPRRENQAAPAAQS